MNLARIGNKYLADTEPWKLAKTDMERVGTILNISLQLVATLPSPSTHSCRSARKNSAKC